MTIERWWRKGLNYTTGLTKMPTPGAKFTLVTFVQYAARRAEPLVIAHWLYYHHLNQIFPPQLHSQHFKNVFLFSHCYNSCLRSGYTLLMQRTFKQVLMRKILGLFFSHSMMLFCVDVMHLYLCNPAQAATSFRGFVVTRTKVYGFSWTKTKCYWYNLASCFCFCFFKLKLQFR